MFRQWIMLVVIVLVYIPVAIDATVLHVAAPTLSVSLGASGNELLWIIDIYSLAGGGLLTAFVRIQLAAANPIIDMRLFRYLTLSGTKTHAKPFLGPMERMLALKDSSLSWNM